MKYLLQEVLLAHTNTAGFYRDPWAQEQHMTEHSSLYLYKKVRIQATAAQSQKYHVIDMDYFWLSSIHSSYGLVENDWKTTAVNNRLGSAKAFRDASAPHTTRRATSL